MTDKLRRELHRMVDDTPAVDVIDRALGTARGMRRRRAGAGILTAAAVVAAVVVPFTLAGAGRPSHEAAAPPAPNCEAGVTGYIAPTREAAVSPAAAIIVGHLPRGFAVAETRQGMWCVTAGRPVARVYVVVGANGDQVWVELIPHLGRTPDPYTVIRRPDQSTMCEDYLDPPSPWPWPSAAPASPGGSTGPIEAPSPSDSWPSAGVPSPSDSGVAPSPSDSWPSYTPSYTPSDSPSGELTRSPSGSPSDRPSGSPSGSSSIPPPVPPSEYPSASPVDDTKASKLYCVSADPPPPATDGHPAATVIAVWPDQRVLVAGVAPAGPDPDGMIRSELIGALVSDPALLALVGTD